MDKKICFESFDTKKTLYSKLVLICLNGIDEK